MLKDCFENGREALVARILERGLFISQVVVASPEVFRRLQAPISEYLALMSILKKSNGKLDALERRRFANFWALNTLRPSEKLREKFFFLLENAYSIRCCDVNKVMLELKPLARDAYLFSHATKLLHSVDPSLPIIDSKIRNFFRLPSMPYHHNKLDRGIWYSEQYMLVTMAYRMLEDSSEVNKAFSCIESVTPDFAKLSFAKKIDSVITDAI